MGQLLVMPERLPLVPRWTLRDTVALLGLACGGLLAWAVLIGVMAGIWLALDAAFALMR
jgi:hypothetical protein